MSGPEPCSFPRRSDAELFRYCKSVLRPSAKDAGPLRKFVFVVRRSGIIAGLLFLEKEKGNLPTRMKQALGVRKVCCLREHQPTQLIRLARHGIELASVGWAVAERASEKPE